MKIIDLFSGIGGFSLGLEATGGFETVQFVENEPWCQKILAKNFPGVPIAGDIREYDGQKADIVVGGFPCQPFSVAGKRKGTRDDRHLWPEMLRVIKACKPRWVIGENVRNLTSIQDGMVFEQVCTDLENENYEVQPFVIPASAVNAPHQRYRVWIVAHSDSIRNQSNLRETSRKGQNEKTSNTESSSRSNGGSALSGSSRDEKQSTNVANSKSNQEVSELRTTESEHDKRNSRMESTSSSNGQSVRESSKDVANSESSKSRKQTKWEKGKDSQRGSNDSRGFERERPKDVADSKISERDALQTNREYGETTPQEVFRDRSGIQRQTSWWSSEPRVGRVAYGVSDKVDRLKGLGNAIVPQIAYQIGLAILQAEDEHSQVD
jgi:DNA (cytosine-5)-methyltransferase 1